jgi:hypothetical protein
MAVDIQAPGMRVLDLFKRVIELRLPFDQIIYEAQNARTKWVHLSHSGAGNRGEIRVAKFGANGKPIAYPSVAVAEALAMEEPLERGFAALELDYVEMDDAPAETLSAPTKKRAVKVKPKGKGREKGKAIKAEAPKAKAARKPAARKKPTVKKAAKAPARKVAKPKGREASKKAAKGRAGAARAPSAKKTSVKGTTRTAPRLKARHR